MEVPRLVTFHVPWRSTLARGLFLHLRVSLDFGGSDLEERFHGPMEVDEGEEATAQQSANEDGLAEAYRLDAIRRRTVSNLLQGVDEARIRGMFEEADAMELEADNLEYL